MINWWYDILFISLSSCSLLGLLLHFFGIYTHRHIKNHPTNNEGPFLINTDIYIFLEECFLLMWFFLLFCLEDMVDSPVGSNNINGDILVWKGDLGIVYSHNLSSFAEDNHDFFTIGFFFNSIYCSFEPLVSINFGKLDCNHLIVFNILSNHKYGHTRFNICMSSLFLLNYIKFAQIYSLSLSAWSIFRYSIWASNSQGVNNSPQKQNQQKTMWFHGICGIKIINN